MEKVRIAKDRDGRQKNFAFITFCHEVSVPYAINLFRGTALFHKKLLLQSRGYSVLLPPPIRCYGPEPPLEFPAQANVAQQFADMTEKLKEEQFVRSVRQVQDFNEKLVMASLQGNWTHRHHPYRPNSDNRHKDNAHHRNEYRPRDNQSDNYKNSNRNKHSNNWRDRRRGNYHRRE